MTQFILRLARLILGLFIVAFGIVIQIQANVGYAPWDVFHAGISKSTSLTIGQASIVVGLVIVILTAIMKEKIGLGSIANMILIGVFIDLIMSLQILPQMNHLGSGLIMLLIGMPFIALGSYFYLSAGFGAGPRDGLMVGLHRRLPIKVSTARSAIELGATTLGWLLGGLVGFGTVVAAVGIGYTVGLVFRLLRFDPKTVKHQTLLETLFFLKSGIQKSPR